MASSARVSYPHAAIRKAWEGMNASWYHRDATFELTRSINATLKVWECLAIGLLALDLVITLYGIGAKIPDTVLHIPNEVALVSFTELIILLQLLQILLPVYPAEEFAMFAVPQNMTDQTVCKWAAGVFGLQEAEFRGRRRDTNANDLCAFGVFLLPAGATVAWKWRRLRRRQRQIRMEEQAALLLRAFRIWDVGRLDEPGF
ncbi:hypothetical protein CGRA01v4_06517 [Colletotrichum graminicola]|uniref:Uncharacterized protein n=1 Tax=Colletotrichum graminicola (strain M1.001 / M2 / FGSC 10212) TaxID=645133 RepID=E3Q245_COLGM|nr:uncharacterized protein GLRG_00290 [Colletotrichum graminicola M1.001]EFQ25146.1 hypothetical protein GLRG_00290 [Colletotrichum graminicola M1.001]WDK15236.1 hypothetical protein CGRA01v4_06517 [Colletotrichum graminicola]